MKLLITTNDNETASEEIKNILGFLDADMKIKNIIPDVFSATQELIDIIGKKTYDYIATKYSAVNIDNDPDYENNDENLVRAAQSAIFSKAYMLYAPSNDLSHTNAGRKMRNEEHEKNAFQWMIDADNEAQEKRYYRAIDNLINLLDSSKTESETNDKIWTIWTTSDEYKKTQSLFIRNTKQFSEHVVIDSVYLFIKLCPGIEECEQEEILPRIGKEKFDFLKNSLKTSSTIQDNDKLLLKVIARACANYAMAYGINRFSVTLLPDGVVQKFTSQRQSTKASAPSLKLEPDLAVQSYMESFNKACVKIQEILKVPDNLENYSIYPNTPEASGGFST